MTARPSRSTQQLALPLDAPPEALDADASPGHAPTMPPALDEASDALLADDTPDAPLADDTPDAPLPEDGPVVTPPAPLTAEQLVLEVQVNRRLRRTYRWRIAGDRLIVERPSQASERDLRATLDVIRDRASAYLRRQTAHTDATLLARARRLLVRYFPERPALRAVSWSARQHKRHGSCTSGTGAIRLSAMLQRYPAWVLDYVLMHELAHLLHPDHSPAFWAVVKRYPLAERARGFLLACDLGLAADDPLHEPTADE
jgi:predicted metal-dependent hydrolase